MDFFAQLAAKVEDEVLACIGCHDCMHACPLPEARSITIAELNEAAQTSAAPTGRAGAFVTACTQCQQCVPVCPAHLSRADMVLWNKIKIEDAAPDAVVPLQDGQRVVPSTWTRDALARELAAMKDKLFDGVERAHLRRMLISSTLRRVAAGATLCREGEYNERLFIVIRGSVEQRASRAAAAATRLLVYGPGSFYGEMGVLGDQPEPFSITAIQDAVVLEIGKATVYRLMRESAVFRATMDTLYARRALWMYVRHSPLLAALPDHVAAELSSLARLRVLEMGETVYREGAPASYMFVVRTGFVSRSRYNRVLEYLGEGAVFGKTALFHDRPQDATVRASTRTELVMIPGDAVRRMLDAYPDRRAEIIARLEAEARKSYGRESDESQGRDAHGTQREEMHDVGPVQGHKVLVIDTRLCTDCNNCVDACERRHEHPRLSRSGQLVGPYLVPKACYHCQDPVCLLCSLHAIRREPTGEITVADNLCIGCGACAERCPYDNIQMQPRTPPPLPSPAIRLIDFITGRRSGRDIAVDALDLLAVKCDLCAGHEDYACVRNCPVGAAMRVDPMPFFQAAMTPAGARRAE